MNEKNQAQYKILIQQAMQSYKAGEIENARKLAHQAVQIMPAKDDAWLVLAACSPLKPRLEYLRRALSINPHNQRTREQLRITMQRINEQDREAASGKEKKKSNSIHRPTIPIGLSVFALLPWIFSVFIFGSGFIYFVGNTANLSGFQNEPVAKKVAAVLYPTTTPFTPQVTIITATPQNTFTPTSTVTSTEMPTETLPPTLTASLSPTATQLDSPTQTATLPLPLASMGEDRWIDIDLSEQKLFAYEGINIVRTFIVSTGTETHPTIPGEFHIYLKYLTDDMAGPGYYLYDVPYVMYYDKGYGIHGTYWHTDFGTPASHGCTNMQPEDAKWLYEWAPMDTLVVIHL
jgi:lipoprotein-anchoring transpeptidase ErfK/SrfK